MRQLINYRHIISLILVTLLVACSSPEEKKAAFFTQGKTYYEQGDYVNSRLELKNAIQIDLKYAQAYYYLGMVELKEGNPRQAFGFIRKATELQPDLLAAHLELGRLFLGAKAFDQAQEKATLLLTSDPTNQDAKLLQASIFFQQHNFSKARPMLEELLASGLSTPEPFLILATIYDEQGLKGKTEAILQQGIKLNQDSPTIYLVLARYYGKEKRLGDAAQVLEKALKLSPDNKPLQLNLVAVTYESGKQQEAISMADKMFANEDDDTTLLTLVNFYLAKIGVDKAESQLQAAISRLPEHNKLRLTLSELYLKTKNVDKAITILQEAIALKTDPADPDALKSKTILARIYFAQQKFNKTTALVTEVLKHNPKSTDAHLLQGSLLLRQGDGESAIAEFRTVINDRPQFIPAHLQLAEAHFLNKEVELAGDILQKARKNFPDSKEVLNGLVRYHLIKKNLLAAQQELQAFLAQHDSDLQAHLALGDVYILQENNNEARSQYEQIITAAPKHPAAYLRLSKLLWKENKKKESFRVLQNGFLQNPTADPILLTLSRLYTTQKQYTKAEKLCRQRLKSNKEDAVAYTVLGQVQRAAGKNKAAQHSFEKAIAIRPQWLLPHQSLAALYLSQGNPEAAISKFKEAQQANPQNLSAYLSLGLLYEQNKQIDNAIAIYRQAITVDDTFWPAYNNLAFLLSDRQGKGDLQAAFEIGTKAMALNPEGPEVLDTMAWINYLQGNTEQARKLAEQGLQNMPDSPVLNYHFAVMLADEGRNQEALDHLQTSLESTTPFADRDKAEKLRMKLK